MFGRLRDLLTGLLIFGIAFGIVDRAMTRASVSRLPSLPPPTGGGADPALPASTVRPADERERESSAARTPKDSQAVSPVSGVAIVALGAAPIFVALFAFSGRDGVPVLARVLGGVAVVALAFGVMTILIARPITPRHMGRALGAIVVETGAVMAAIAVDAG